MDLSRHNFNLLEQVMRALERIDHGAYGRCSLCQGKIETAVLTTTPWAALCSSCERRSTPPC